MRRIGRWVAILATLLASLLMSAVSAGSALAAGVPPYVGSGSKGGKGIDRSQMLPEGPPDWTTTIVLFAIIAAAGVIVVGSRLLRQSATRRRELSMTPTLTR